MILKSQQNRIELVTRPALAQYYLSKRNLDVMLYEVQRIKTKPGMVTDIILFCLRFDGVFREDTTLFSSIQIFGKVRFRQLELVNAQQVEKAC